MRTTRAVVNALTTAYHTGPSEFPSALGEGEYRDRLSGAYPIHPEPFGRLYEGSTLDHFQRTRGVLRFMAAVIHQLWLSVYPSLLIRPAPLLLTAAPVRNEILRYLPDTWTAVVDHAIDGTHSVPTALGCPVTSLGHYAPPCPAS